MYHPNAEPRPEYLTSYDHLNEGGIPLKLDFDTLAEQICGQNYGFVRMCAAMCRVMRKRQASDQARYDARGDTDIKVHTPLTDAIEGAVMRGAFY